MAELKRSAEDMSPLAKKFAVATLTYAGLWVATRFYAPVALTRQLQVEAQKDWQHHRAEQEKSKERYPGSRERMAFSDGPKVEVELLSCPAPFFIRAECGRAIGGLNGYGTVGWYLLTPWKAYSLSVQHTWVS